MSEDKTTPSLFGLSQSNRDFTQKEAWGKNQFNSSFPASLACYMYSCGIKPVYIKLNKALKTEHYKIDVSEVFGEIPLSENLFFAFESDYLPYRKFVVGKLPRVDLVTQNIVPEDSCLKSVEIKLTALPDNSTYKLDEDKYGCEIVVRPDTIVYLALSIASKLQNDRQNITNFLEPAFANIEDLTKIKYVVPKKYEIINSIDNLLINYIDLQSPLVIQPVWKTVGKTSKLFSNCLDMFVWSDFAFTRLFFDVAKKKLKSEESINRYTRTVIWLAKMLYDFGKNGKINHQQVIDYYTYNTKNDKAFAINGLNTHPYMTSQELLTPRIRKEEIRNIIMGGGQNYLSPERRFDAIVLSNPEIFDETLKDI
ncbi:MAG: HindVP family restriction endonuclease [Rivularia sp. (in: Bacteria)]|nr:HindVP family restriction endonuclease [Rivularia sp. MS3]